MTMNLLSKNINCTDENGKEIELKFNFHLSNSDSFIHCLEISNDSKYLITADFDKTLRIFNLLTGVLEDIILIEIGHIRKIFITNDSRIIVFNLTDTLGIIDLEARSLTKFVKFSIKLQSKSLCQHEESLMAISDHINFVQISLTNFEIIRKISFSYAYSIMISLDCQNCLIFTRKKAVKMQNIFTEEIFEFEEADATFQKHRVTHLSQNYFASVLNDNLVYVWDYNSRKIVGKFCNDTHEIYKLKIAGDEKFIIVTSDYELKIWSLSSFTIAYMDKIDSMFADVLSNHAIILHYWQVAVVDLSTNLYKNLSFNAVRSGSFDLKFSSDYKYLVGNSKWRFMLLDVEKDYELKKFTCHDGKIIFQVLSKNNENLLTYGRDQTLRVWNVKSQVLESCFVTPFDIKSMRFYKNEKFFLYSNSLVIHVCKFHINL